MVNQELQRIIDILPLLHQILGEESYISVLDEDSILRGYAIPEGEVPKLRPGERMEDITGCFDEVMATGRKKKNFLPKEVMGAAFEGLLVPIKDDDKVVGCITYCYSIGDKEDVKDMAQDFQDSIQAVDKSVQNVIDGIKSLFEMLSGMTELTDGINNDVQDVTDVVQKISGNASRSNILALNASIEAARSGDAGRGFAVVANSMGELANDSGSSAKEIGDKLNIMQEHLTEVNTSIKDVNGVAKSHMDSISEIHEELAKTIRLAEEMQKRIQ